MMARKLLDEHPDPADETIKHYLSGNLCRCVVAGGGSTPSSWRRGSAGRIAGQDEC
jgi:hypothetical protein